MSLYNNFTLESQELEELQQLETMVERTLYGASYYRSMIDEVVSDSVAFRKDPEVLFRIKAKHLPKVLLLQKNPSNYLDEVDVAHIDYQALLCYIKGIKL